MIIVISPKLDHDHRSFDHASDKQILKMESHRKGRDWVFGGGRYPLDGTILEEAVMDLYTETIRNLPLGERLKLVQTIWDDIVSRDEPILLPPSAVEEAKRRRDEMVKDPTIGLTHNEVWKKIKDERG